MKQIEARYGKPGHVYNEHDRPGVRKLGYRFGGLMVIVCFKDGISKWESFMGWPQGNRFPRLSRERVKEILALSAPKGKTWQSIPRTENGEYWISSDKKTVAFLEADGTNLLVRDPNFDGKD